MELRHTHPKILIQPELPGSLAAEEPRMMVSLKRSCRGCRDYLQERPHGHRGAGSPRPLLGGRERQTHGSLQCRRGTWEHLVRQHAPHAKSRGAFFPVGAAQRTEQPQATPRDTRPREWKEARWAEEAPRAPTRPWWAWLPRSAPPGGVGVLRVSAGVCTVRTQWCPWPTSRASRDHSFVCSFTPSLTNAD